MFEVEYSTDVNIGLEHQADAVLRAIKLAVEDGTRLLASEAQRRVSGLRPNTSEESLRGIQKSFLRPSGDIALHIQSGDLYRSLGMNEYSHTEERDNEFIGIVGTDVTSDDGFPYGKYWEGAMAGGGKHNPWPRKFLQPSLQMLESDIVSFIRESIAEALNG